MKNTITHFGGGIITPGVRIFATKENVSKNEARAEEVNSSPCATEAKISFGGGVITPAARIHMARTG